jgi:hypothetical protein
MELHKLQETRDGKFRLPPFRMPAVYFSLNLHMTPTAHNEMNASSDHLESKFNPQHR